LGLTFSEERVLLGCYGYGQNGPHGLPAANLILAAANFIFKEDMAILAKKDLVQRVSEEGVHEVLRVRA